MAMCIPFKLRTSLSITANGIHIFSGDNPPISHGVMPQIPSSCLPMRWMLVMLLYWVIMPLRWIIQF